MRAVGSRVSLDGMPPSEAHGDDQATAAPQQERPPLPSSNWRRDDPVPVALDTFMAAVDWLEAAPPLHRSAPALSDSAVIEYAREDYFDRTWVLSYLRMPLGSRV